MIFRPRILAMFFALSAHVLHRDEEVNAFVLCGECVLLKTVCGVTRGCRRDQQTSTIQVPLLLIRRSSEILCLLATRTGL